MIHRRSYALDPSLGDRVFDLLEIAFPGVSTGRRNAAAFGVPWESCSTPFVAELGAKVIAHVGLLEIPLRIGGRDCLVGGVHGVSTHPEHRHRGLFRSLLSELLSFASGRYETFFLTTLHPEYFEAFGFRVVPEFVVRTRPSPVNPRPDVRQLDLTTGADRVLLHRLIETRRPVSDRLGVGSEKACWGFVEFGSTIRYDPWYDVAVVGELAGGVLRVYDLIGRELPRVEAIASMWPGAVQEVLFFMSGDLIDSPKLVEPHDLAGGPDALEPGTANWVLMARGPFSGEGEPIMLPRPTRC